MVDTWKYLETGFGEPLKFFCRFVLLTVCSRNPGDLCNVTPNHRLNIGDKILTSVTSLQGSHLHSTGCQPCVWSYRGTPLTWIYSSKTSKTQPPVFLGCSIVHILCFWPAVIAGEHVQEVGVAAAWRWAAYQTQDRCVCSTDPREHLQLLCWHMLKQACATTQSILVWLTCQQEVSGMGALRSGEVQERHFPQGQSLFKINPGPVVRPTAATVCVLLFQSKQAISLSSVALW